MSEQWNFITPDIEKTAHEFGLNHLQQRIRWPPGPIYHYTTGDNLIKIIKSGELWSTQAACMNDTKELVYAVERLAERAKLQKIPGQLGPLWQAFDKFTLNPDATTAPIFLTCFSERDDDLSQWRAYGAGEGGYSIGFDGKKLLELGNEVFLFPVDYKEDSQNVLLDKIIERLIRLYESAKPSPPQNEAWAAELVPFWLGHMNPFAAIFKHPKFEGEKEWRLVQYWRADEKCKLQFRQRRSFMSRHMPIRSIPKPLPIVSVRVGPARHPELSKIAVRDLLTKHDYALGNIEIEITRVPYRQN
jgi:hypothetical protein